MDLPKTVFTAAEVAKWVSERMKGWEDVGHCTNVIQWYMNNRLCGVAGSEGRILGVALIRFLRNPDDGDKPYMHEPDGNWNWVELVVADAGVAISSLFDLLFSTYGKKPFVAFRRGLRKNGEIKKYTIEMFHKMDSLCMRSIKNNA